MGNPAPLKPPLENNTLFGGRGPKNQWYTPGPKFPRPTSEKKGGGNHTPLGDPPLKRNFKRREENLSQKNIS